MWKVHAVSLTPEKYCATLMQTRPKSSPVRGGISKRNRKVQLDCDHAVYKQRNGVERMFCRFKDWRRVATRYDRNIKTFMATIAIAATVIWWLN